MRSWPCPRGWRVSGCCAPSLTIWAMSPSLRRTASARFESIAVRSGSILGITHNDEQAARKSRVKVSFPLRHVAALELHCHMLDAEQAHGIVHVFENMLLCRRIPHDCVSAHRHHPRTYGPDMQVVN